VAADGEGPTVIQTTAYIVFNNGFQMEQAVLIQAALVFVIH